MRGNYFRTADGREVGEDEALRNGVVRDGYVLRAPFTLMDGVPSDLAATARLADARAAYDRRVTGAWRDGHPVPQPTRDGQNCYDAYDSRVGTAWRAA